MSFRVKTVLADFKLEDLTQGPTESKALRSHWLLLTTPREAFCCLGGRGHAQPHWKTSFLASLPLQLQQLSVGRQVALHLGLLFR